MDLRSRSLDTFGASLGNGMLSIRKPQLTSTTAAAYPLNHHRRAHRPSNSDSSSTGSDDDDNVNEHPYGDDHHHLHRHDRDGQRPMATLSSPPRHWQQEAPAAAGRSEGGVSSSNVVASAIVAATAAASRDGPEWGHRFDGRRDEADLLFRLRATNIIAAREKEEEEPPLFGGGNQNHSTSTSTSTSLLSRQWLLELHATQREIMLRTQRLEQTLREQHRRRRDDRLSGPPLRNGGDTGGNAATTGALENNDDDDGDRRTVEEEGPTDASTGSGKPRKEGSDDGGDEAGGSDRDGRRGGGVVLATPPRRGEYHDDRRRGADGRDEEDAPLQRPPLAPPAHRPSSPGLASLGSSRVRDDPAAVEGTLRRSPSVNPASAVAAGGQEGDGGPLCTSSSSRGTPEASAAAPHLEAPLTQQKESGRLVEAAAAPVPRLREPKRHRTRGEASSSCATPMAQMMDHDDDDSRIVAVRDSASPDDGVFYLTEVSPPRTGGAGVTPRSAPTPVRQDGMANIAAVVQHDEVDERPTAAVPRNDVHHASMTRDVTAPSGASARTGATPLLDGTAACVERIVVVPCGKGERRVIDLSPPVRASTTTTKATTATTDHSSMPVAPSSNAALARQATRQTRKLLEWLGSASAAAPTSPRTKAASVNSNDGAPTAERRPIAVDVVVVGDREEAAASAALPNPHGERRTVGGLSSVSPSGPTPPPPVPLDLTLLSACHKLGVTRTAFLGPSEDRMVPRDLRATAAVVQSAAPDMPFILDAEEHRVHGIGGPGFVVSRAPTRVASMPTKRSARSLFIRLADSPMRIRDPDTAAASLADPSGMDPHDVAAHHATWGRTFVTAAFPVGERRDLDHHGDLVHIPDTDAENGSSGRGVPPWRMPTTTVTVTQNSPQEADGALPTTLPPPPPRRRVGGGGEVPSPMASRHTGVASPTVSSVAPAVVTAAMTVDERRVLGPLLMLPPDDDTDPFVVGVTEGPSRRDHHDQRQAPSSSPSTATTTSATDSQQHPPSSSSSFSAHGSTRRWSPLTVGAQPHRRGEGGNPSSASVSRRGDDDLVPSGQQQMVATYAMPTAAWEHHVDPMPRHVRVTVFRRRNGCPTAATQQPPPQVEALPCVTQQPPRDGPPVTSFQAPSESRRDATLWDPTTPRPTAFDAEERAEIGLKSALKADETGAARPRSATSPRGPLLPGGVAPLASLLGMRRMPLGRSSTMSAATAAKNPLRLATREQLAAAGAATTRRTSTARGDTTFLDPMAPPKSTAAAQRRAQRGRGEGQFTLRQGGSGEAGGKSVSFRDPLEDVKVIPSDLAIATAVFRMDEDGGTTADAAIGHHSAADFHGDAELSRRVDTAFDISDVLCADTPWLRVL